MIVDDGYDIGRDYIVKKATKGTHWNSMWWRADVEWNENDLLQPGHEGTKCSTGMMMVRCVANIIFKVSITK